MVGFVKKDNIIKEGYDGVQLNAFNQDNDIAPFSMKDQYDPTYLPIWHFTPRKRILLVKLHMTPYISIHKTHWAISNSPQPPRHQHNFEIRIRKITFEWIT